MYIKHDGEYLFGKLMKSKKLLKNKKGESYIFYHSPIKDWPQQERPREKLLRHGSSFLSEAELLAILIESGSPGITALDLAKKLLIEYRNLPNLAAVNISELIRMRGIGPARGTRILAAFEIGRRIEAGVSRKTKKVQAPEDIVKSYRILYRDIRKEIFKVILLDSGNRIIRDVTISQGTLNASIVHPREVFKSAIDYLAAAVILLHNHPSGEARPSAEDKQITTQLIQGGKIMGIPVLDHIIFTKDSFFSFAKEGLLRS